MADNNTPNIKGNGRDFISAQEASTLPGLFQCRSIATPQAPAFKQYDEKTSSWQAYSWAEMAGKISN